MSWEREYHHINLDEGEYRIGLVEKSVQNRHGEPSRFLIQIYLGSETAEHKVGHQSVQVRLGGDLRVKADGSIQDAKGKTFDPREFEKAIIAQLGQHHANMRLFARKHNVPELKTK